MNQNKNKSILPIALSGVAIFLATFLFLFAFPTQAAVSKNLNYQGLLADSAGTAVADGSYTLHLKIYTLAGGGSAIWSSDQAVTTKNGVFSTLLDVTTLNFDGSDFFLGVAVGTDPEMTPRKQLGSVPQAINANNVIGDGVIDITGDATIGGNVGIGTTAPNNLLQVAGLLNFDPTLLNTFVGEGAGFSNTTGSQNFFGGYQAGYNSISSRNVFSGYQAGYGSSEFPNSNSDNTFIGHKAGFGNSDGAYDNTGVGSGALQGLTTGGDNIAIGSDAGFQIGIGSGNIFLGVNAGSENIDGNDNIFIGKNVSLNGDNKLNIGNLIYGDFSLGNVGLGTTAPATLFSLASTAYTFSGGGLSFGDMDTGFFESADDELNIRTANSDRLTIDSGGNVGIGTTDPGQKLEIRNGNLLVGQGDADFILTPKDTATDSLVGAWSVAVSGDYAFVLGYRNASLVAFNIANPDNVVMADAISANISGPWHISVRGNYAYVADDGNSNLAIFDISNPNDIVAKDYINTNIQNAQGVVISDDGNHAFVVSYGNHRLVAFDVSDPDNIIAEDYISTNLFGPWSLTISGNYVYVASYQNDRLAIFDVSNPDDIVPRGYTSAGLQFPRWVAVSGNYAYVVDDGNDRLSIFDVSDPDNIVAKDNISGYLLSATSVAISGKYAYANNYSGGFVVFDISDPDNIVFVDSTTTNLTLSQQVVISGEYAYLADENNGLVVFEISDGYDSIVSLGNGITLASDTAPALSGIGQGTIYFDSVANIFKVSENGGAYANLLGESSQWTTAGLNIHYGLGNVGIGTTAPNNLLQVAGLLNFDPTLFNTFVGEGAGLVNTTGNSNAFLGYHSGYYNTTGSNNVFIGGNAGKENILGGVNTFVGDWSGGNNVNGFANVAIGRAALVSANILSGPITAMADSGGEVLLTSTDHGLLGTETIILRESSYNGQYTVVYVDANTFKISADGGATNVAWAGDGTGSDSYWSQGPNTALGTSAGENNSTGFANVFNGYESGFSNTTGSSNFFGGYQSGYGVTGSNNDVAIGYQALYAGGGSNSDVAIGYKALYAGGGSHSVAIGFSAGQNSGLDAWENVFVGYHSGMETISGNMNTFVGTNSGMQNISGIDNVLLGYNAGNENRIASGIVAIGKDSLINLTQQHGSIGAFASAPVGEVIVTSTGHTLTGGETVTIWGTTNYNADYVVNSVGTDTFNITATWVADDAVGNWVRIDAVQGQGNSALGFKSGMNTTYGNYNTFTGYQSGFSNTTGSKNFFGGYQAGMNNNGDGVNTFLGTDAGRDSGTANWSVLIGYEAGRYLTEGSNANVFVGIRAGENLTQGVAVGSGSVSNTFIGHGSGRNFIEGEGNVFLGTSSGDALLTGDGNILIGYGVQTTSTSRSDFLNIANTIYGDLALGNVGIGTSAPDTTFKVVGSICARNNQTACAGTAPGAIYADNFIAGGTALNIPDYVFEADYNLMPLDQLAAYISEHKHLPGVPSAMDVEKAGGLNLGQMVPAILEKTEENTLYILGLDLKTDSNITTIQGLQTSVDEQLDLISVNTDKLSQGLTSLGLEFSIFNDQISKLEEKDLTLDSKITAQDSLIAILQGQMLDLQNKFNTETNLAQIDLNTQSITTLEMRLGTNRVIDPKDVDILGKLSAKIIATGGIEITVIDPAAPTIGIGIIKAGEKDVTIDTTAAQSNSQIFITPKKALEQSIGVTKITEGESFTAELFKVELEDVDFSWWIVQEK